MRLEESLAVYPIAENLGAANLFVEREELTRQLDLWVSRIPKKLFRSQALMARKKSGKTVYMQRLYNHLWNQNGAIIPFYFEVPEMNHQLGNLAQNYYCQFASQLISFLTRESDLVARGYTLEEIKAYGKEHNNTLLATGPDRLLDFIQNKNYEGAWSMVVNAPTTYAQINNTFILVMIDEFQNFSRNIHYDHSSTTPFVSTAGAFHSVSESRIAPLLVTGSNVGSLTRVLNMHLQGARIIRNGFSPYLTPEESLKAVYLYADFFPSPLTNEAAVLLSELTFHDPFYIDCIFEYPMPGQDLTTEAGVRAAVKYQVESIEGTVGKELVPVIRNHLLRTESPHAKNILLFINYHDDAGWSPNQIKLALKLEISEDEILHIMEYLADTDLIRRTTIDTEFIAQKDGTFSYVLQTRFRGQTYEMINHPDRQPPPPDPGYHPEISIQTRHKDRGKYNQLLGKYTEFAIGYDLYERKTIQLEDHFVNLSGPMHFQDLGRRQNVFNEDGLVGELDLIFKGTNNQILVIEVKNTSAKIGGPAVAAFIQRLTHYQQQNSDQSVIGAIYCAAGFTKPALELCEKEGIGVSQNWKYKTK